MGGGAEGGGGGGGGVKEKGNRKEKTVHLQCKPASQEDSVILSVAANPAPSPRVVVFHYRERCWRLKPFVITKCHAHTVYHTFGSLLLFPFRGIVLSYIFVSGNAFGGILACRGCRWSAYL